MSIRYIALIAPASLPTAADLKLTLKNLKTRYPEFHIVNYAASKGVSAKERFDLLWQALSDERVDFLWTFRGGEGSADVIPYLEERKKEIKRFKPKTLMGFSDITALLFYWHQTMGWPAIHGPGARQVVQQDIDRSSLQRVDKILKGESAPALPKCLPYNALAKNAGPVKGPVVAGNLTLLSLAQRELWDPKDLAGHVLVIEDLGEPTYRVRRALYHLQRVGLFNNLAALVIGDFFSKPLAEDKKRNTEEQSSLRKFLKSFSDSLSYPVYATSRIGHGKANYAVVFAEQADLGFHK
jgi:muramoyltetrapeptide carboxypeptidase